jgi:hypothetical protein
MQMKISDLSAGKAGFFLTGIALVFAVIGVAGAETYQQGGSSVIIDQSGGSKQSESSVTRYKDGQTIITRDGSSTDITIQRENRSLSPDDGRIYPEDDRFDRRFAGERFAPDRSGTDYAPDKPSCTRDAFKQRMLDRMRGFSRP